MRFLICDTETSGLGPKRKAVEVAVLEVDAELNIIQQWESLIDPECPIDEGAEFIHGISADMVKDAPTMEEFVTHVMGGQLEGELVICGHNCKFDIPMLHPLGNLVYSVCTLELARACVTGPVNFKLETLREFFGIPAQGTAHRAMADVRTTYELLKRILPMSGRTLEQHALTEETVIHTMSFGKHAGKALFDLPAPYISWLLALPDLDSNLRKSLEVAKLLK